MTEHAPIGAILLICIGTVLALVAIVPKIVQRRQQQVLGVDQIPLAPEDNDIVSSNGDWKKNGIGEVRMGWHNAHFKHVETIESDIATCHATPSIADRDYEMEGIELSSFEGDS